MYRTELTIEALEDLKLLRKYDRSLILDAAEKNLKFQPSLKTKNRKRLSHNRLAEWELRVGDFRVFYDVFEEASVVKIVAVGYKKGARLFIHGEEYDL